MNLRVAQQQMVWNTENLRQTHHEDVGVLGQGTQIHNARGSWNFTRGAII